MATKTFDPSKFRKNLTKSIPGMSVGFRDPDTWISTGNYTLNKLISGDFHKGIPLGKVTVLAGESGSGKSLIASGSIVKHAQKQGIFVILIDTENALDESWLHALEVDTSEDKLLKLNMAMIDDVAKVISNFVKEYKANYADTPTNDRPKVLFVIDSLGMLLTPTEVNQFESGDMKGDMGRKARQLKALVTNCVNMFGDLNIGLVATQHSYESQDMFSPDPVITGGSGFIYASSIVVAMGKLKLKEDEDGNKTSTVYGIRANCKVTKTRYSKPFEVVQIKIPYTQGLDPYSGLVDFFENAKILQKSGNKLEYTDPETREVIKLYRKQWEKNTDLVLDRIMDQYALFKDKFTNNSEETTYEVNNSEEE
jgi:RecA/RadA recombinase